MCGRAAYSAASLLSAASALRCGASSFDTPKMSPNISPGSSVLVFRCDRETGAVYSTPMIWGLLPNNGTPQSPHLLPSDDNFTPSPHYIMFNARSETIDVKKSFHNLLRDGKSCIFAVDGYYEWTKSLSPIDKKKQPYFVKSTYSGTPLLLAGLWREVKTGRTNNNNQGETISTFTILTTEAHPKYSWLHPRMPCILKDSTVAREWLQAPSKILVDQIRSLSSGQQRQKQSSDKNKETDPWECYPVTKKMNDASYQAEDCTVEIQSKGRKLESYFASKSPSPSSKRLKVDKGQVDKGQSSMSTSQQELEKKHVVVSNLSKQDGRSDALTTATEISSNDNDQWSCHVCTFLHTKSKSQFLACEMCGSKRG